MENNEKMLKFNESIPYFHKPGIIQELNNDGVISISKDGLHLVFYKDIYEDDEACMDPYYVKSIVFSYRRNNIGDTFELEDKFENLDIKYIYYISTDGKKILINSSDTYIIDEHKILSKAPDKCNINIYNDNYTFEYIAGNCGKYLLPPFYRYDINKHSYILHNKETDKLSISLESRHSTRIIILGNVHYYLVILPFPNCFVMKDITNSGPVKIFSSSEISSEIKGYLSLSKIENDMCYFLEPYNTKLYVVDLVNIYNGEQSNGEQSNCKVIDIGYKFKVYDNPSEPPILYGNKFTVNHNFTSSGINFFIHRHDEIPKYSNTTFKMIVPNSVHVYDLDKYPTQYIGFYPLEIFWNNQEQFIEIIIGVKDKLHSYKIPVSSLQT